MESKKVTGFIAVILLAFSLLLASGCFNNQSTSVGLPPERLAIIGVQVNQAPDRYQQILEHYNITSSEFEKALIEVTEDVQMARRYSRVFNKKIKKFQKK